MIESCVLPSRSEARKRKKERHPSTAISHGRKEEDGSTYPLIESGARWLSCLSPVQAVKLLEMEKERIYKD